MNDEPTPDTSPDEKPSDNNPLHELRHLILNQEQEELATLRERLEFFQAHPHAITAEELSDILPEAVVLRSTQDQNLDNALASTIEESIQTSVKKDPQPLVDAIFPVIGPAIRKSISSALNGTIASMNQTLEHSFSIQGLKWRIEAYRTGRSFGEVVLTHTLLYRVEQVFLIHHETGLLLQHVVAGASVVEDADMVSSMLTAIQDFVRDSFGGDEQEQLNNLQVGDYTIWIERGPAAILAAVIRGSPHQDLRETLQHAIETIHLELGPAFRDFSGDTKPFDACQSHLQDCLESQLTDEQQESKRVISPAFAGVLAIVLILLGTWAFFTIRDRWRWSEYLDDLNAQPGIVVTDTGTREGLFYVEGLRDPLAADPKFLLNGTGLTADKVTDMWEPYQAFDPVFMATRAARVLELPPSAELRVEGEILYLSGAAPKAWLATAYRQIRFLPAVTSMVEEDFSTLEMQAMLSQKELLETLLIDFPIGSSTFGADAQNQVETVSSTIVALISSAKAAGYTIHIEITGHTDATGSGELNQSISQKRADQVYAALIRQQFDADLFTTHGRGASDVISEGSSEEALAMNRRVNFRVFLTIFEKENNP